MVLYAVQTIHSLSCPCQVAKYQQCCCFDYHKFYLPFHHLWQALALAFSPSSSWVVRVVQVVPFVPSWVVAVAYLHLPSSWVVGVASYHLPLVVVVGVSSFHRPLVVGVVASYHPPSWVAEEGEEKEFHLPQVEGVEVDQGVTGFRQWVGVEAEVHYYCCYLVLLLMAMVNQEKAW